MEAAVSGITTRILYLGLEVAAQKTEALSLHGTSRTRKPTPIYLYIHGECIKVNDYLK